MFYHPSNHIESTRNAKAYVAAVTNVEASASFSEEIIRRSVVPVIAILRHRSAFLKKATVGYYPCSDQHDRITRLLQFTVSLVLVLR